ncbi:MAG: hypothetical protein H7125_17735, partial [Proteobacteria bacterium]|nr:hypothetical protein [Burkholderiales bacterium]
MSLDALRRVAMPGGEVPLMPGELFFGHAPARLATLLGACVSVTLWHEGTHTGGICHFVVPGRPQRRTHRDGRFGDEALEMLAAALARAGLHLGDCQIKLFGGGGGG